DALDLLLGAEERGSLGGAEELVVEPFDQLVAERLHKWRQRDQPRFVLGAEVEPRLAPIELPGIDRGNDVMYGAVVPVLSVRQRSTSFLEPGAGENLTITRP